jgi:hypothetical protein
MAKFNKIIVFKGKLTSIVALAVEIGYIAFGKHVYSSFNFENMLKSNNEYYHFCHISLLYISAFLCWV